jgi:hypothetical protein
MKKSELIQIIKEEIQNTLQEVEYTTKAFDVLDEVGKFFIVTKPSKDSTKEDIMFESDVFHFANQIRGGLKFEDVLGIYKQKSDANRRATEVLKEYESQLEELKTHMDEFRKSKKDIEDKKSKTKELINKLK